ncbi:FG-GAP-like repeat-containing protein [Streptomyces sp. NPDC048197]|uniref:FG-GAP-like repeat-containing protein n=1 Tax=Streptomyces sp. NPDC048197 TaxID=3365511 RepID=UPI003716448A
MQKKLRTALAAASVAALTGGLLVVTAAPSTAASAKFADDFNGDGYRDLAVSAPGTVVGGHDQAGAVVITYGSAGGLQSGRTQVVSQSSSGVPGASEEGDRFGAATAAGDFNNDGYADLAVGAPGEDTTAGSGTGENVGAVTVLWGSRTGLSGGTALETPPVAHPAGYGQVLASGDFDGDGLHDDVAVGLSGDNSVFLYRGGTTKSSTLGGRTGFPATSLTEVISLAAGDVDADGVDDLVVGGHNSDSRELYKQSLYLGRASSRPEYAGDAGHGQTAAVGDVDGDGYADIVTGHPWDQRSSMAGTTLGGNVSLTYGSAGGRDTSRPTVTITQNTEGIPGASETNDNFGHAVALDDINGDGRADLVVGAPYESIGAAESTGSVTVIPGSASGLATTSAHAYDQGTTGVPGAAEGGDHFGEAVALTDTNGDGKADLAVGASGENNMDGAVWSLKGRASGLTTTGAVSFGAGTAGLPTSQWPEFGVLITG